MAADEAVLNKVLYSFFSLQTPVRWNGQASTCKQREERVRKRDKVCYHSDLATSSVAPALFLYLSLVLLLFCSYPRCCPCSIFISILLFLLFVHCSYLCCCICSYAYLWRCPCSYLWCYPGLFTSLCCLCSVHISSVALVCSSLCVAFVLFVSLVLPWLFISLVLPWSVHISGVASVECSYLLCCPWSVHISWCCPCLLISMVLPLFCSYLWCCP